MPGGSAVPHPVIAAPIRSRPSKNSWRRWCRKQACWSLGDLDAQPRYGLSSDAALTGEHDHAHQGAGKRWADLGLSRVPDEITDVDLERGHGWPECRCSRGKLRGGPKRADGRRDDETLDHVQRLAL